jgi:hypothetical protein
MSHFITTVLVEGLEPDAQGNLIDEDIEAAMEEALAPFNENTEVLRYKKDCYCIGHKARMAGREAVQEKFGEPFLDACRAAMAEKYPGGLPIFGFNDDAEEAYWNALLKPREDAEAEATAAHPMAGKPDPECDECKGKGWHFSTYNKQSQWDWYRIGGRWNGFYLPTAEDADSAPKGQYGLGVAQAAGNYIPVKDLLEKWDAERFVSFALLTPEGDWLESGSMGWWGIVSGAMSRDEWKQRFRETLEKYPNAVAVAVDCHI